MIEAHCEYRLGARYDDELEIRTRARWCRRSGSRSTTKSCGAADGAVLAAGHTVHATIDRSGRPVRLPARVKELLT